MQLTFIGATHEVTGSCTYLSACGKNILVDYGMEQGKNVYENVGLPILPFDIDYVFLTHAHIDHSGLLPLLYKNGFKGEVHSTITTHHLCDIMLLDSAHIQEQEAEYQNRKGLRSGEKPVQPLYDSDDARGVLSHFVDHRYDTMNEICEGIKIRFTDAGHLLGSSSIEVFITEGDEERKIVFSGDIGNQNQPLIRNPSYLKEADYVVMESTYGNRNHEQIEDNVTILASVIQRTLDRGGNVVIPAFAVGRTQEILYYLRKIKVGGLVKGHDGFPVYVDSPLAIAATKVFVDNAPYCYGHEAAAMLKEGINPIGCDDLVTAVTSEESIAINTDPVPKIIISASGMCDAGRVRHHLKHNLWRPESTILFVGYQAVGTPGRTIHDGAKKIKLFGEEIAVQAEIAVLRGLSGHADHDGLVKWINSFEQKPKRVFINHGDSDVCDIFAAELHDQYGFETFTPYSGTEFDLRTNEFIRITMGIPVEEKKEKEAQASKPSPKSLYAKLLIALDRLASLIRNGSGRANADVEKMTRKINDLCNEWEDKD